MVLETVLRKSLDYGSFAGTPDSSALPSRIICRSACRVPILTSESPSINATVGGSSGGGGEFGSTGNMGGDSIQQIGSTQGAPEHAGLPSIFHGLVAVAVQHLREPFSAHPPAASTFARGQAHQALRHQGWVGKGVSLRQGFTDRHPGAAAALGNAGGLHQRRTKISMRPRLPRAMAACTRDREGTPTT